MNKKTNKHTRSAVAAGLLGVALAVSLGVGSSFAWFNDTVGSDSTITIGTFGTNVSVVSTMARSGPIGLSGKATVLPAGFYGLVVRGQGNTVGYARIFFDAQQSDTPTEVLATQLLTGGTTYTYNIMLHEPTAVSIVSVWDDEGDARAQEDGYMLNYGRPPMPESTEEEPSEEGAETDSVTGDTSGEPTTGGTDSASSDSTSSTPPSGDTGNASPSGDTGNTPSSGDTGSTSNTPSSGSTGSASSSGDTGGTPSSGDTSSTPSSGNTGGASDAGADPE